MNIKQKDIKLLWGRSANRCAICRIVLTQDKNTTTSSYTLGEQAHIIGEKEDAARGKSTMPLEEKNSYHNLILLCPNHHTEIDNNEDDWPIEKLHQTKSKHELWVTETLSETIDHVKLAKQIIVSGIVDAAVTLCELDEWQNWTSFALSPEPRWAKERPDKVFQFRQRSLAAIWPKEYEDLKKATITFSVLLNQAALTFMEHSYLKDDMYWPDKFYKADRYNPNYHRDLEEYEQWQDRC